MAGKNLAGLLDHLQRVSVDRAELETLRPRGEALLQWARAKGFDLNLEEAERLVESLNELSDDELDKVAGGDDAWGGTTTTGGTGGTTSGGGNGSP
jgi:hypothetical protein